jgi:hypothetical protein
MYLSSTERYMLTARGSTSGKNPIKLCKLYKHGFTLGLNYARIHNSQNETPLQVYDITYKPAQYVTTLHLKSSYEEQAVTHNR